MILETGRITVIEAHGLWVETIHHTACNSCKAQKGCGHSLLAKFGSSASQLWVLWDGRNASHYRVGDQVQIGVPEDLILRGALFIYIVPLTTLLVAILFGYQQAASEGVSVLYALGGLLLGAIIVRWRAHYTRFDKRLQPVLVGDEKQLGIINIGLIES